MTKKAFEGKSSVKKTFEKKFIAKKSSEKKFLVIVESPAKAKTLNKILGKKYTVIASVGHVRDLPKSKFGIEIKNDDGQEVNMQYMTVRGKTDTIKKLKDGVKNSDFIYLATDPDREGEAIAWHLFVLLKLDKNKAKRISFNEITKTAVQNSVKGARDINMNLVDAQQARRALDRIVGYKISPILWHKIHGGLSAGRVQSVAVKIICDRELERENFVATEYWSVDVILKLKNNKFAASFFGAIHAENKKEEKIELNNEDDAKKILDFIDKNKDGFYVSEVKKSSRISKAHPPFITSSLQQEAAKLLGFNTAKTMRVAQQLYEGVKIEKEGNVGLISYIRTDSVRVSDEAYEQAKKFILERYGQEYLAKSRPVYKIKENAQDAHEAIRPTDVTREPDILKNSLSSEQYKLYKLIWQRFVASQMAPADYDTQSVKILNNNYLFKTSGSVLKFNGYLIVYDNDKEKNINLPELKSDDKLKFEKSDAQQHFTQPPARFTEATLVKTLEELGIGRPSTYATIISNIKQRNYVAKEGKAFYPTELGKIVNQLLEQNFNQIVNVDFTFKMELLLDKIEIGKVKWTTILIDFYFPFMELIRKAESEIDRVSISDEVSDVVCEKCGRNMVIKRGRYGKFLACPGFPECKNIKPYLQVSDFCCPKCGKKLIIKKARKGNFFYVCEDSPECDFISWKAPKIDDKKNRSDS